MMRNLGSVCVKLGRSETMMIMNTKGRRGYSTGGGSSGDFEGGWRGALGTGWRTLARCSAFYFIGYKLCGENLKPFDTHDLKKSIEEADSDAQTYLERINIAERTHDALLKRFGPKQ